MGTTLKFLSENTVRKCTFGNGDCPEQAINNYAKEIQFQTIVVNARSQNRREITVPRLTA